MFAPARFSRTLWALPIVIAAVALMVLPGASFLSAGGGVSSSLLRPDSPSPNEARATVPTSNGLTSAQSALLSGLPADLTQVPWIQSLTHQGSHLLPLTSLPNLALLKHPVTTSAGTVDPFYVSQPAPLGLADYGLGATPYSYNTSHFLGEVTFNTPPNVTDPASTGVIEPGGSHDGYVGSFYEFGIQLNTVATKMSIPGSDQGFFWTQNVVNWNDTGIHFVDDTFNLTSATQNPFYIAPGTIYSGCNNGSAGVNTILYNYGGVFQCVGGTIPVSPASYPVTIQLYNNASVNAQNRTQLTYGYRIVEAGLGKVYTGISDTVVFNSPGAPGHAPKRTPGFSVDAFAGAPSGLFRDAEIVLVGDIGGDNSAFRAVNGSIQLEYSNRSSGGFRSVPSAYNFGGNTGETSTGIADYWTTSHTLEINQGPAMLYGLWNAQPSASVGSGDIHLAGSISPSYGFVFVSNTPAVLNPWATGARDNLSWLPTTNSGSFSTYLPPLGSPWTTQYYVQAFAAGSAEKNGTPVTGSTTSYAIHLTSAPGVLRAPLYMYSNAQAASLAKAVTGSSIPPFDFNGLVVNINSTFNHLNDYGYPTFVLFMAQDVTQAIDVNNTYQGTDSPTGNYYFYDFAPGGASTGVAIPGPAISSSLPYFTSGINVFGGVNDAVTDQVVAGDGYGLQVNLWDDSAAQVSNVASELLGSGVWVGDSVDTSVWDVYAVTGATAVTDIGSTHTTISDIEALGGLVSGPAFYRSTGIEGLSSSGGIYSWVYAANGGFGISVGDDYGIGADYDAYYYLPGTTGVSVYEVSAYNGSWGANFSLSEHTSVSDVWASLNSIALFVDDSQGFIARHVFAHDHSTGVYVNGSSNLRISWVFARNYSIGVYLNDATMVRISHITATGHSIAVYVA